LTWLTYIAILSPFIPILAFFFYSFNRNERLKWVFVFILFVSVLLDSLGNLFTSIGITYKVTFNLYVFFEGVLLYYFFYKLFYRKKTIRKMIFISAGLLFSSWLFHNVIKGNIGRIDRMSNGIESIMIIAFCLFYFYFEIRSIQYTPVTAKFEFWLVTATFIYVSITFFIFLIPLDKDKNPNDHHVVMLISRVGNIIYSFLLTIAFMID